MDLPKNPILCIDFDGVINSYTSGWKGTDVIPDPPVPGAIEALLGYMDHFTVCLVTSRFNAWQEDPQTPQYAVTAWLRDNGVPVDKINRFADTGPLQEGKINFCTSRPAAVLTIDDRGWTFDGTFPSVEQIKAFRTWQKRDV